MCGRCFRYLGSIERQLTHRLLLPPGSRTDCHDRSPDHDRGTHHRHSHGHDCGGGPLGLDHRMATCDHKPHICGSPGGGAGTNSPCDGDRRDRVYKEQATSGAGKTAPPVLAEAAGVATDRPASIAEQAGTICFARTQAGSVGSGDEMEHSSGSEGDRGSEGGSPEAIAEVQPQLQRLALGSESLPLSERFPLPQPVPCRAATLVDIVTDEAGHGGDGPGSASCGGGSSSGSSRQASGWDDLFCSEECERAAWETHGCLLQGCGSTGGSSLGLGCVALLLCCGVARF